MAKICDICGGPTGFRNTFRCQDGVICKNCYKIVSNQFTTTITKSTLAELKKTYIKNAAPLDMGEGGFWATKKIANYLMLDENNRKFCISSNRMVSGEYSKPEIFRYEDLGSYKMVSDPKLPQEQLAVLAVDKHNTMVIKKLVVRIRITNVGVRDLIIIPTPVRSNSFAFRRAYKTAEEVMSGLDRILFSTGSDGES